MVVRTTSRSSLCPLSLARSLFRARALFSPRSLALARAPSLLSNQSLTTPVMTDQNRWEDDDAALPF